MFLLSPVKLRKLETAAPAPACARGIAPPSRARSFAGLGNSANMAVVDARLRLPELIDALACPIHRELLAL
jgi:hypothetical protein